MLVSQWSREHPKPPGPQSVGTRLVSLQSSGLSLFRDCGWLVLEASIVVQLTFLPTDHASSEVAALPVSALLDCPSGECPGSILRAGPLLSDLK